MIFKIKLIFIMVFLIRGGFTAEGELKNIYNIMDEYDLPGLTLGILKENGDVTVTAYGMRDNDQDEAVTAFDVWHIGSCTKSMTSTLLAILIEEQKLSWDDKVSKFFPEFNIHERLKDITLRQMTAHQSGIGPESEDLFKKLWSPDLDPIKARLMVVEEALESSPEFPQGEEHYANPNFIIAGAIMEKLTGIIFEELMVEKLFKPLGMDSCGFGAPGSKDTLDAPRGHSVIDGKLVSEYVDNPPAYSPSGRVHCNLKDWGAYAFTHLHGYCGKDTKILKGSSFKELHQVLGDSDYTPGGWVVMETDWGKGTVLWHDGSNSLFKAHIWIAPEIGEAYMLATNVGSEESEVALIEALKEMVKK